MTLDDLIGYIARRYRLTLAHARVVASLAGLEGSR